MVYKENVCSSCLPTRPFPDLHPPPSHVSYPPPFPFLPSDLAPSGTSLYSLFLASLFTLPADISGVYKGVGGSRVHATERHEDLLVPVALPPR